MLRGAGIDVMHVKDETGLIGTDDVVDAAAAVWTARRFAAGNAVRYPAQEADGVTADARAAHGRDVDHALGTIRRAAALRLVQI